MPDERRTEWADRPILMPADDFAEVLEYLGEWRPEWTHTAGVRAEDPPAPSMIGDNEVGPYCSIRTPARQFRSIAVRPTAAAMRAIEERGIVTPDDSLSFRVIEHEGTGRALVILEHGYIIGSMYLAHIDASSIPAPR